jgi:hypothetical protein
VIDWLAWAILRVLIRRTGGSTWFRLAGHPSIVKNRPGIAYSGRFRMKSATCANRASRKVRNSPSTFRSFIAAAMQASH